MQFAKLGPVKSKLIPPAIIITVVFIFAIRLIWPPSFFTTPDFGRSDATHSNLPVKLLVAKSLKNFTIPLWENDIGQGYPVFAEDTTGFFFLPNLVIFSFLPFKLAIPVMYISTLSTAALGMYLLCQKLKLGNIAGVIAALAFAFSASMITHIQHFNFIQTASLLPLLFLSLVNFLEKKTVRNAAIASLIASQMFLAGFVQIYVYSILIMLPMLLLYTYIRQKRGLLQVAFGSVGTVLFSLVLSAVQILPTYELTKLSARSAGVPPENILHDFPISPKNYLTFVNPFILGKSADGTYNSTNWQKHGIFWENTSYIGILPLIFFFVGLVLIFKKHERKIFLPIALAVFLAAALSLGKLSPLHVLFSFPPLNFFRVPARFILLVQFFAIITAAYGLKKSQDLIPKTGRLVLYVLLALVIFDLYHYWWNYNPIGQAEKWLAPPQFAQKIQKTGEGRVFSLAFSQSWNEIFTRKGWVGQDDYFYFFRNSLAQNINILYGISQFSVFEALPTRRYLLEQSIIKGDTQTTETEINLGKKAINILKAANVRYLTSPLPIKANGMTKIDQTQKEKFTYYLYEVENPKDIASLYYDFRKAKTVGDYVTGIEDINIDKTVFLENTEDLAKPEPGSGKVNNQEIKDGYFSFEITSDKAAIFTLANSYYPGWQAKVDGKETKIYAANINSQAILVPDGNHLVTFEYKPRSFKIAASISLIAHFFALLFAVGSSKLFDRFRKRFIQL